MATAKKVVEPAAPVRRKVKGAAPMTYESVRLPNVRGQLQQASRADGGEVNVEKVVANVEKEG